jgi:large-conductance mechanosensitive channel
MAFIVLSITLNDIDFIKALIVFTLITFCCYIIVNFIDHLNNRYIMNTVRAIMDICKTPEKETSLKEVNEVKKKVY